MTIPRWEWRCFAPSLTRLAERAGLPPDAAPHDSDETYILDLDGSGSRIVKIRDGMLDIKRRLARETDGLELWLPVLKTPLPLSREDVTAFFGAFLPAASIRTTYALDALLAEIVAPQTTLRAVPLHKTRRGFVFDDCRAELTQIRSGSLDLQTFSLEHEDPQRLRAALQRLRLDPGVNSSYETGLKHALGFDEEREPPGAAGPRGQ